MDSLLKSNNVVRVIALVLAVMLWLVVRGTPQDTASGLAATVSDTVQHNVDVLYDKDRVTLAEVPNVKITLHGDRLGVIQAKWGTALWKVTVDARNRGAGTYTLPVMVEGLPQNVTVDPAQVQVTLIALETRSFDVQVKTEGELDTGYAIQGITVSPAQVQITGPADLVAQVKRVEARVSLNKGDTDTVKRDVTVSALDVNGQPVNVSISPQTVQASIVVAKRGRVIPLRFQFTGLPKEGFAVESYQPSVTSVNVFGNYTGSQQYLVPPIDLSGIDATNTYTVPLPLLPGVTALDPAAVEVQVNVTSAAQKTFRQVPLKVVGLPTSLTADLSTHTVDVVVEGAPHRLDALTADDLQAVVDLTGQDVGTHTLNVQVSVPEFLRILDVRNGTVQVTVRTK